MSVLTGTPNGEPEILNRPPKKKTRLQVGVFIDAYAQSGSVTAAAKAAGISRMTHYRRAKKDPEYRKAVEELECDIGQRIEDAAVLRAIYGSKRQLFWSDKPIKHNGRLVYEIQWDTSLQLGLLKRFRAAQYREHTSVEHSGSLSVNLAERLQAARQRLIELRSKEDVAW